MIVTLITIAKFIVAQRCLDYMQRVEWFVYASRLCQLISQLLVSWINSVAILISKEKFLYVSKMARYLILTVFTFGHFFTLSSIKTQMNLKSVGSVT